MDAIYPTGTGYQGLFLVGYRKDPAGSGANQLTGVVLLKRTYTIAASNSSPAAGTLTPTSPLPIYMTDQPNSLALRYEHDLAPYKPEGDVIVLGFSGASGQGTVTVNGQVWLRRNLASPAAADLFGWQPRSEASRSTEGDFASHPLDRPLPTGFQNRFFNGYLRAARQLTALPYLPKAGQILIERDGTRYGFTLGSESITARYDYYRGSGPDDDCAWRRQAITMNLDTLVIDPGANKCYVVWRGAWPFAEQTSGAYRRVVIQADG